MSARKDGEARHQALWLEFAKHLCTEHRKWYAKYSAELTKSTNVVYLHVVQRQQ